MTRAQARRLRNKIEKLTAEVDEYDSVARVTAGPRSSSRLVFRLADARAVLDGLLGYEDCPGCHQILTSWNDHKEGCKDA